MNLLLCKCPKKNLNQRVRVIAELGGCYTPVISTLTGLKQEDQVHGYSGLYDKTLALKKQGGRKILPTR